MSGAVHAAKAAMSDGGMRANNEHLNRVVQSVTDATKRLSQISTASSNVNVNTKTSKRKNRDTVGPWKLGKTLGKGSSGRVRLAKNMETGKLAAIKIVPKKFVKSNVNKQLPYGIEREIIIMKLISHPNVMGLYEVWENRSELYLVLEYVEGGELFDYLVSKGKLPESEAIHYFKQIVEAVAYCHGFNICHRDLKPENLLLDKRKKSIKIADFGMAALETSEKLLETSCGSPHYASPEIVQGLKYHGSPSDVWSCGIILFALLTGHLPFNDDNVKKLLLKVQSGKYQMPQWLSVEAKDLISRILVVDPSRRITIEQILQHGLLKKYNIQTRTKSDSNLHLLNSAPKIMNFSSEKDIDETILSNLQILWHGAPRKHLVARLMKPGFTEEKMFFSLLWNYQEKQQKSMIKESTPVSRPPTDSVSSVTPSADSTDGNHNSTELLIHASMDPSSAGYSDRQQHSSKVKSSSISQESISAKEERKTLQAPHLQQRSQFSINSLKNSMSKHPRKTKQGFIASSSSSKIFKKNMTARPSSSNSSLSKSSSKKSLTPVTPIKRTLQNSASKRSLYSLQSISKRSINLKELLKEEISVNQQTVAPPPLPSISSSQHTSSKIESIVDDYDKSTTINETSASDQFDNTNHLWPKNQPPKNILAQPKLNATQTRSRMFTSASSNENVNNPDQSTPSTNSTHGYANDSIKSGTRVPVSLAPLKDMTNTFQTKRSSFIFSLDPKQSKPSPTIETLLKKVSVPQRAKSRSAIRKLRNSGDWSVSQESQALFGNTVASDEKPEHGDKILVMKGQQHQNKSKTQAELTVTRTPVSKKNSNLLRIPSTLVNSSTTFRNLSQFILDIDEDKIDEPRATGIKRGAVQQSTDTLPPDTDHVSRFETSSNYEDFGQRTKDDLTSSGVNHANVDIDIFEDAPGDSNDSLTTSESLLDQSQPNLKKKASSIDSINTTNVLTPATDVRVSLYVNQMEKVDQLPRETTEQIISKFNLTPTKEVKQKRFSHGDRETTVLTGSSMSIFKDLDVDLNVDGPTTDLRGVEVTAPLNEGTSTLGLGLGLQFGNPYLPEKDTASNRQTGHSEANGRLVEINGDDEISEFAAGKRVTLLFDDGVSEAEAVFKPVQQPSGHITDRPTQRNNGKRKSYTSTLPKIKEFEAKPNDAHNSRHFKTINGTNSTGKPKNNWFTRLLRRIRATDPNEPRGITFEHRINNVPFDDLHIVVMTQFGKDGVDCELQRMERKGNREFVSYECNFGPYDTKKWKRFQVIMKCDDAKETVLRVEKVRGSYKKFIKDASAMAKLEQFDNDLSHAIALAGNR